MTINNSTTVVQHDGKFATMIDEKVVVLGINAGAYFTFNRTGSQIWNMLARPCRVGKIIESLSETYHADAKTLASDVTDFLQSLIGRHLVRIVGDGEDR